MLTRALTVTPEGRYVWCDPIRYNTKSLEMEGIVSSLFYLAEYFKFIRNVTIYTDQKSAVEMNKFGFRKAKKANREWGKMFHHYKKHFSTVEVRYTEGHTPKKTRVACNFRVVDQLSRKVMRGMRE